MNTLRAKIAVLLVVAIVSVVDPAHRRAVLSARAAQARPFATHRWPQQVEMLVRIVEEGKTDVLKLVPERSPGRVYARLHRSACAPRLPRAASRSPSPSRATEADAPLVVSIPVDEQGWLLMPISDLPPQGVPWNVLLRWLALITLGATAIAVFVANRMVQAARPARECRRVGRARRHALPRLPERGPAEVRATARALNSLSARLKSAVESRMRLVAAAGHDLRTPITRMRLQGRVRRGPGGARAVAARSRRARAHRRQRDPSGARGIRQGAARADQARRAGRQHRLGAQGAKSRRGQRQLPSRSPCGRAGSRSIARCAT